MNYLSELKKRNVFKVAVAYMALGWIVVQVTDVIVPALNLPAFLTSIVVYIGIIGFPFALFLAWAYELTPDGVKRTVDIEEEDSIRTYTGRKINYIIIALLSVAVLFLLWDRAQNSSQPNQGYSIAVLPFEDLSEEGNQSYFSDGLSDELLHVLAKIPVLQVAGRTSSFAFKNNTRDLREIGLALGVEHILEGSVRKQASRVRITVQLIRTADGFNMWSETFDRELSDIFTVQEEIANAIVSNLALTMDIDITPRLFSSKTQNIEAYDLYLKAKALLALRGTQNIKDALVILKQATDRDPNYAATWGLLAQAHTLAYYYPGIESTFEGMYLGEEAARTALIIDPMSSLAHGALGDILKDKHHWNEARAQYKLALEYGPENTEAIEQYGQFLLRTGYLSKALPYMEKARLRDPLGPIYNAVEAMVRDSLRDYERSDNLFENAIKLSQNGSHIPPVTAFLHGLKRNTTSESQKYLRMVLIHNKVENPVYFNDNLVDRMASPDMLISLLHDTFDFYSLNPSMLNSENSFESLVYASLAARHAEFDLALEFLLLEANLSVQHKNHDWLGHHWIDVFDPIQNDPRFKYIRVKLGLVDYWRSNGWPDFCRPVGEDDFKCKRAHEEQNQ